MQDPKLEKKYEDYKRAKGGALKMTIEEIRRVHYKQEGKEDGRQEGKEQGREEEKIKIAKKLLDVLENETIALKTGLTVEFIESLR